jgi:hypothetical protein
MNVHNLLTLTYFAVGIWALVGVLALMDWCDFVAMFLGILNFMFSWILAIGWVFEMIWFITK